MKLTDYYGILGVSPSSDDVVIRAAFKALMLKYHPDTNTSPDATHRAAQINAAFTVLGNPSRRAEYDKVRVAKSPAAPKPPPPKPPSSPPKPPPAPEQAAPTPKAKPSGSWMWGGIAVIALIAVVVSNGKPIETTNTVTEMNTTTDTMNDTMTAPDAGIANEATATGFADIFENKAALDPNPTALSYDDIESAVADFDRVLRRNGMLGARSYSERCHKKVQETPSWPAADRCAAFDFAASYLDSGVSKVSGARSIGYFSFAADNQSERYSALGASPFSLGTRLDKIKVAAQRELSDRIDARAAQNEPTRTSPDTTDSNSPIDRDWLDRVTGKNK